MRRPFESVCGSLQALKLYSNLCFKLLPAIELGEKFLLEPEIFALTASSSTSTSSASMYRPGVSTNFCS